MPIYMEIAGIQGESTSDIHPHTFELTSFSWGVRDGIQSNSTSVARPIFLDITVMLHLSLNVPKLFLAVVQGQHFAHLNIYDTNTQHDRPVDVEKMMFTNAIFTSFTNSGSGGNDLPAVQLTFTYGAVQVESKFQNDIGNFDVVDVNWSTSLG